MARLPVVGSDNGSWGGVLNSFLQVGHVQSGNYAGSLTYVSSTSSNYTIGSNASVTTAGETVLVNAGSGSVTITLPDATATYVFNVHNVKKTDSTTNTVVINTTSGQTIDGASSATIKVQYASITLATDGANWFVI